MGLNPQARLLWGSIRNPNCEECPLHEEAQSVCLVGDGPVPAEYMIVGEAPGYREDEISRPFSGRSGKLLDEVLEASGLNRKDAFVTNVVKCRPPDNATPKKLHFNACRHYLDDEIEAVKPKFMLLLGNSALSTIKKSGIMKHRGEEYELGSARVFATVHPAAVLRNPKFDQLFRTDVATFGRMVRGEAGATPPKVYFVANKEALATAAKAILKADAVAYDLETSGIEDYAEDAAIATIGVGVKPGVAFVVPISHPLSPWKNPQRALEIIGNALVFTKAKKIAHNAKFDDRWLNQFGIPIKADFDTMIAAHMLDENRFKGLKPLAQMVIGADPWKDVDLSNGGSMGTPLGKLARYNAKDADYTLRLYYNFRKELLKKSNARTLRLFTLLLMPASRTLTEVERNGLWVDQERLKKRRIQVSKKLEDLNRSLTKIAGYELNWNSTQQVAELLFGKLKLPLIEMTAGGAPSSKESVLLRLRKHHPVAAQLLEWRKWSKYKSTYLERWAEIKDKNDRLHPNYKITGTVTGRLSSGKEEGSKGRGLNVQQIPRDPLIRSIIGAPPGWRFVEADFSQIELRIAAHYSGDSTLQRYFIEGYDVHLATAVSLTGKLPKHVTKEERKKAKAVNFGFLFGMGAKKFVEYSRDNYDLEVSLEEAQKVRDKFFRDYSGLRPWHDRQRRLVNKYERVQSAIGRVRHLPDINSEDKDVAAEAERQAINSPVQSLASDLMLMALSSLHEQMDPAEAKIVGTVHDSILFEVRKDKVKKWTKRIKHTMENPPLKKKFGVELTVPIVADITVGQHWGEGEPIGD